MAGLFAVVRRVQYSKDEDEQGFWDAVAVCQGMSFFNTPEPQTKKHHRSNGFKR